MMPNDAGLFGEVFSHFLGVICFPMIINSNVQRTSFLNLIRKVKNKDTPGSLGYVHFAP